MSAPVRVTNDTRGHSLGDRIAVADRWWRRLRGLLGRRELREGEGLLIDPCPAVHTYGMGFAIDVAMLDARGRVLAAYPALPPGRRTPWSREGRYALELPAGTLARTATAVGDQLSWAPLPPE